METKSGFIITRNQLKIIAAAAMLIDHIGAEFFPEYMILRIIGRIAFPIFSFAVFEGAKYTHNRSRYFLRVFGLGLICMLGYYIYSGELYGNVLITFSLSLILLYSLQYFKLNYGKSIRLTVKGYAFVTACLAGVFAVCNLMYIDYGFIGVLLPVFAELFDGEILAEKPAEKWFSLSGFAIGLLLLSIQMGNIQYYSLLALPLLVMVDEKHEKIHMKYFFYIFYPIHLILIGGISAALAYL